MSVKKPFGEPKQMSEKGSEKTRRYSTIQERNIRSVLLGIETGKTARCQAKFMESKEKGRHRGRKGHAEAKQGIHKAQRGKKARPHKGFSRTHKRRSERV